MDRRLFLSQMSKTSIAIAVLGISACGSDDSTDATTVSTSTGATPPTSSLANDTSTTTQAPSPTTSVTAARGISADYQRVNLGNVSAYLLIRSGEIALIDTGNPGSESTILDAMAKLGLDWSNVGHIGVTHSHGDHAGSLDAIAGLAGGASIYAALPDLQSMNSPRAITEVTDGSSFFGLSVIATPGHTPGSICFHDDTAGLLFAGDALNGTAGGVTGANPRFTADIAEADNSVRKLAQFAYETILFGHGEPVLALGDQQVAALADSL